MKKNNICKKFLLLILVAISCFSFFSIPVNLVYAESLPSGLTQSELETQLDSFLQEKQSATNAGVAIAVFNDTQDLYVKYQGFANKENNILVDSNTVFEWGSVTKLVVWVSAFQLAEQNKIDLNKDIKNYLPKNFLRKLKYDTPITMMNLMNHTAGFEEMIFNLEVYNENEIISLKDFLYKYQPNQVFKPGEVVAYSNWGAALAGYIVEYVSGLPFYEYAQQNIFKPLNMLNTAINSNLSDNLAVKEKRKENSSRNYDGTLIENSLAHIIPYPAGMCTSNLNDFSTFAKALMNKDNRLLTTDSFDKLYTPSLYYTNTDKARCCHGFWVQYFDNTTIIGHGGATVGYKSELEFDLQNKIGMVVLSNITSSAYTSKVTEKVFGTYSQPVDYFNNSYKSTRNVFSGPLKIIFNLFANAKITSAIIKGYYINVLDDKLELDGTDYLVCGFGEAFLNIITIIWLVSNLYLLALLINKLILKIKKKQEKNPLKLLSTIFCFGLLSPALILIIFMETSLGDIFMKSILALKILTIVLFIYLICLIAFTVYYLIKTILTKNPSIWILLQNIGLIVCSIITILIIILWDFAAFWLV
ncbi:MAG: serine hydrolase [Clostridia bacterium]|nr:serine hydrolase [Clostridia bacterium]